MGDRVRVSVCACVKHLKGQIKTKNIRFWSGRVIGRKKHLGSLFVALEQQMEKYYFLKDEVGPVNISPNLRKVEKCGWAWKRRTVLK